MNDCVLTEYRGLRKAWMQPGASYTPGGDGELGCFSLFGMAGLALILLIATLCGLTWLFQRAWGVVLVILIALGIGIPLLSAKVKQDVEDQKPGLKFPREAFIDELYRMHPRVVGPIIEVRFDDDDTGGEIVVKRPWGTTTERFRIKYGRILVYGGFASDLRHQGSQAASSDGHAEPNSVHTAPATQPATAEPLEPLTDTRLLEIAAGVQSKARSHLLWLSEQRSCSDWEALYEKAAIVHGWRGDAPQVFVTHSGVQTACLARYYKGPSPFAAIGLRQAVTESCDSIAREIMVRLSYD